MNKRDLTLCKSCGITLTADNAQKKASTSTGLSYSCKTCKSEEQKAHYKRNPETYKKCASRWSKANRSRCNEIKQAYVERYPDRNKERHRLYTKNNPESSRNRVAKRRDLMKTQLTQLEKDWVQFYYDESQHLSTSTGIPYEVDHIIPISKGGVHAPWNLQVLTQTENRRKYNKCLEAD